MPSQRIPRAEIIAVGDEMTGGARIDTNTAWLAQRVEELGVTVAFHSTVGDNLDDHVQVIKIASERADFVVMTGGLGPTRDDLSREAISRVMDRPLKLDQVSLRHIESMFAVRKRVMPERNDIQAMFPEGSQPIFNPQGTAPGIDVLIGSDAVKVCRLFALPGVPAEMKQMFSEHVAPAIADAMPNRKTIKTAVMKFFGIGESDMEARLGEMISRTRSPRVGITVSKATISLRIQAIADSEDECLSQIEKTRQEILERAGDLYFGDGENTEQHHAIENILSEREQTVG
ncbi:MAG: CinA family nicotinamide mononucleotide deamidase-related protein, partial [Planctomycetota bacterium]